jgi:hypothetical protein
MAEYAQMQQIMNAQDTQQMNALKLQEYQRTREEEEGTRNFLRGRDLSAPDTRLGLTQFGKTGLSYAKSLQEQDKAVLDARNIQSQIGERDFGVQKKKLDFSWGAVGSASTPQAAIAEINKGVKDGVFDANSVRGEVEQLQNMTPEQYQQYRVSTITRILDAKDKLAQLAVTTKDTDRGGFIERQTYNAQGVAVGQPIKIDKTVTPGDVLSAETARAGQNLSAETARTGQGITLRGQDLQSETARAGQNITLRGQDLQSETARAGQNITLRGQNLQNEVARGNLSVAQRNAQLAQEKFAFERANPGFELKEDGDGNLFAINKRTLQAVPVTVGGAAPAAGPGMPGPRVPAPGVAAPDAAVAPGTQFRGKTGSLTESQGNATAYGMRMREANAILEPLEKAGKTNTGLIKGVVGGTLGVIPLIGDKLEDVSGSVFNALPQVLGGLSPAQQQVAQARINFITAILRKESGAAIGRDEFATAEKNYFPKPGDNNAAIAQKQQARRTAIKAMEIQAGPGARQMGGAGGLPGATANNPLALPIPGR